MEDILAQISKMRVSYPDISLLEPNILKLALSGAGIFLLLALLAFTRHHLINTSLRGLWAGFVVGIIIVLGVEAGAYYFYQNYIIGDKGSMLPPNFQVVLGDTKASVTRVLGERIERKQPSAREIVSQYRTLDDVDSELVRAAICKQK